MKRGIILTTLFAIVVGFTVSNCSGGKGVNLFSLEDDKAFGLQVSEEIAASPDQFPVLDRNRYANAYKYLEDMKIEILKSPHIKYKEEFAWKLHIIHDDETLNAFATPGGYIYVYTGLIHYLNSADALAGVMGHELAHSDRRHSTSQMTKQYGMAVLLEVLAGDREAIKGITGSLLALKFSRGDESDADAHSVKYLCGSKYRATGAADFFEQISAGGGDRPPEFLSTHPNPDNRVGNIKAEAVELGCGTTVSKGEYDADYEKFKKMLPPQSKKSKE